MKLAHRVARVYLARSDWFAQMQDAAASLAESLNGLPAALAGKSRDISDNKIRSLVLALADNFSDVENQVNTFIAKNPIRKHASGSLSQRVFQCLAALDRYNTLAKQDPERRVRSLQINRGVAENLLSGGHLE